ncbi:MAG TPA: hypothetical protein ENN63_02910 [Bacteroidetes bacterium]|nr:hypothetical protein [Bacteroidota bacterium]
MPRKDIRKIREQIRSGNPAYVMEGIRICRDHEEADILSDLVRVLGMDTAPSLRQAILGLISDLNSQHAVPVLVRAIRENPRHPCLQEILAACWQSRMIFHEHIPFLIDLIISGDYMISLESLTILENASELAGRDILEKELNRLETHIPRMNSDKQNLVREMIRGLRHPV